MAGIAHSGRVSLDLVGCSDSQELIDSSDDV